MPKLMSLTVHYSSHPRKARSPIGNTHVDEEAVGVDEEGKYSDTESLVASSDSSFSDPEGLFSWWKSLGSAIVALFVLFGNLCLIMN
jgi:hypothetical protein